MKAKAKTPIAVILTDTHLDEDNSLFVLSIFVQACRIAEELGLDTIYHAGDFFDSRKAQTQKNLNTLLQIFDIVEEKGITLIGIPGNHDKTEYALCDSFIDTYRKEFTLVRFHLAHDTWRDFNIHMVPFFNDEHYREVIGTIDCDPKKKNVLITHIGMNGAVMNNGIKLKSGITQDLFDKFDLVLIGHYHDAFEYSAKIKYIGASLQHNYGESPDKGLCVLYSDLSTEIIPLLFPKYINYEVDVTKVKLKDIEDIKKEKENSINNIRITLCGNEKDIKSFDINRLKAVGVDVKRKQEVIKQEAIEERVEAFDDVSILDSFTTFCENNKLNHKEGLTYLEKILI